MNKKSKTTRLSNWHRYLLQNVAGRLDGPRARFPVLADNVQKSEFMAGLRGHE